MDPAATLFPDPLRVHPLEGHPRVVLLKPLVTSALIEVGEFSYYDDPHHADEFETRNVLHHYGPDRLVIGRFCAFAAGSTFLMNGANHRMDGPSTFPFPIMGDPWATHVELLSDLPTNGDTVVGHDVWIGHGSLVMPGVHIGHGAIVATGSVVVSDVPAFAIVGGNPARVIRFRYTKQEVEELLAAAWWDWPFNVISEHLRTIATGTVTEISQIARDRRRD